MTIRSSLRLILNGAEKIVKAFDVIRNSEQKFKRKGVRPLWPRARKMEPSTCWDLKGIFDEGRKYF